MRESFTTSFWAMRDDCCMSATCIWTRFIRALKSKVARTPRISTVVTARLTRSSIRVKPASARDAGAGDGVLPLRIMIESSVGLQDAGGEAASAAQGERLLVARVPDLHLDLLDVDVGRAAGQRRVERVVILEVVVF